MTVRGVPEGVQPPAVTALSPSSLHVSWSEPTRPSGIIQQYRLNQTGVGTIFTHNYGPRNFTVTGEIVKLLNASVFIHFLASLSFYSLSFSFASFFTFSPLPSLYKYYSLNSFPVSFLIHALSPPLLPVSLFFLFSLRCFFPFIRHLSMCAGFLKQCNF